MDIKKVRELGAKLGRKDLAERALTVATLAYQQGDYKLAIECCGRMALLAKACGYDDYWASKIVGGEILELEMLEDLAARKPPPPTTEER